MAQFEFDRDEVEGVLSGRFYSQRETTPTTTEAQSDKPTHYKVICISIYNDDLEHLDELVKALKKRGRY